MPAHGARAPGMAREDAERCEHGGRGADRGMAGVVQGGVQPVAERACQKDQEPAEAGAGELGHQHAGDGAEGEVAQQMIELEVQAERRDRAPPRAILDQARLRSAGRDPVDPERMPARGGEEEHQDRGVSERPVDPVERCDGWSQRPLRRVLARPERKLAPCPCLLQRRDVERCGAVGHDQPAADADRGQHERLLLGRSARARPADLDQFRGVIVGQERAYGLAPAAPLGSDVRSPAAGDQQQSSRGGRSRDEPRLRQGG